MAFTMLRSHAVCTLHAKLERKLSALISGWLFLHILLPLCNASFSLFTTILDCGHATEALTAIVS
jgi:hypothetical protein